MNLIFIGPQGSGKGTQAKIISEKLNLCHISTGDLLRNVKGNLKEEVDSYINVGKLVPDELILKILIKLLILQKLKEFVIPAKVNYMSGMMIKKNLLKKD